MKAIDWAKVRGRFAWIAQSRKAQVALGSIALIVLSKAMPRLGFTPAEVQQVTDGVKLIASVWIGSIALEDAAEKNNNGTQPPSSTGGNQASGN